MDEPRYWHISLPPLSLPYNRHMLKRNIKLSRMKSHFVTVQHSPITVSARVHEDFHHNKSVKNGVPLRLPPAVGTSIFLHGYKSILTWKINYIMPWQGFIPSRPLVQNDLVNQLSSRIIQMIITSGNDLKIKLSHDVYYGHKSERTTKIN